jgi:hypothetical protein
VEESTVAEIIEESVRSGEGKKGPWEMHKVRLENDVVTNIFAPIAVGDPVESYQNGDYINWRLKDGSQKGNGGSARAKTNDEIWTQGAEILKRQERIESALQSIVRQLKLKNPAEETADLTDKPLNLDDIPF